MIRKYQIVLNKRDLNPQEVNESGLVNFNGYLVNPTLNLGVNEIVNQNDVMDYLEDPSNISVVTGFTKYLKENTYDAEFKAIYYVADRVTPILNDYYKRRVRLDIEPRKYLIKQVLSGGSIVYYDENYYDWDTQHRTNDKSQKVITTTEEQSYYLDIFIDSSYRELESTDFSKYLKDCVENGVVLKNCFVNLNKADDPFEFWSNSGGNNSVIGNIGVLRERASLNVGSISRLSNLNQ